MDESQRILSINQILQFLESPSFPYVQGITDLLNTEQRRLIVSLDHVRKHNDELYRHIIEDPASYMGPFQEAVKRFAMQENDEKIDLKDEKFYVGFIGSLGRQQVSPRELNSSLLTKLVSVKGIITKCSLVHPRLLKAVQFCEETGKQTVENFADPSDPDCAITSFYRPKTKDETGNALSFEYGNCVFKDHQTALLQELPENSPTGQLPRSVRILIDDDLVDIVKPGDRVEVVGIFQVTERDGNFPTYIIANSITKVQAGPGDNTFTRRDVENIKEVAKVSPFERLSRSLAPSIFGHEFIKKAMLLQLMNGIEKTTANGMHLRGDIHILLVGDPSTAKSQLLRYVLSVAPLAISTNGRGASGVGLTAAITSDSESRERVLEAGAMVLADRGIVCIDEFDKMDSNDRAALHEVMEQQTVTIQKAGIHTSLNARCSVFAAANPLFGNYNREKSPTDNIGFPDSLLSRFDLLFIVLDNMDMKSDRILSEHVLKMHRYISPNQSAVVNARYGQKKGVRLEDLPSSTIDDLNDEATTEIFNSEEKLIFGTNATLFSTQFIKKYIEYAKRLINPVLTPECCSFLSEAYSELRTNSSIGTLPITARALDSLVRLSEAHARCRLSNTVTVEDAQVAVELMRYSLYGESSKHAVVSAIPTHVSIRPDPRPQKRPRVEPAEEGEEDTQATQFSEPNTEPDSELSTQQNSDLISQDFYSSEQSTMPVTLSAIDVSKNRQLIRDTLLEMFESDSNTTIKDLVAAGSSKFTEAEAETVVKEMEREGLLMYDEGNIYHTG